MLGLMPIKPAHAPALAPAVLGHCRRCAIDIRIAGSGYFVGAYSEPASFQPPFVAPDIFGAQLCQTELSFLKFPADQDEALLFGFAQCLQACAFRGRLPVHTNGAVQQDHYLDYCASPWSMPTAVLPSGKSH
ncbi:hypothetical protein [Rhizobium hidalgonense]|uniref:hypothetical protein n=1 Tax=Rhizobium hidalgonense TaxID=1538159 RepID=UPI0019D4C8FB